MVKILAIIPARGGSKSIKLKNLALIKNKPLISYSIDLAKKLKRNNFVDDFVVSTDSKQIAEELDYIGTLCVEFFIDANDNLYVNEIAPRVHNSGLLTIIAYNVSQFENHIRAICNFEKIKLKKLSNAEMINLLGDQILIQRKRKLQSNEFFYDYLKKEIKPKRKMGHLTILKK